MGDFGSGFSGGDWNGNGHFDAGDYEIWKDTVHGSGGGSPHYSSSGLGEAFRWVLIIAGVLLACIFPPFGLLIWLAVFL